MRRFMIFALTMGFGLGGGVMVAASGTGEHDHGAVEQHEEMDHSQMGHAMSHDKPLDLAASSAPTLDINVTKDRMAG